MKSHSFTTEDRATLLAHKHVRCVTNHQVMFTFTFKKFAVKEIVEKGRRPQDIFVTEGIPVSIIGSRTPERNVAAWKNIVKTVGVEGLRHDGRGRSGASRTHTKKQHFDESVMNDKELIAYYKAKISYTEAENDFLARTRGIPRMAPFEYHPGSNTNS